MSKHSIPSAADVRRRLQALSLAEVKALAGRSGVPFTTMWKVRAGETKNPGVETIRAFWPELIGTEGAPAVPVAEAEVRDAA